MQVQIVWLRRDIRLADNAALFYALKIGIPVIPIFIFDQEILSQLPDNTDARVSFIHQAVQALQTQLVDLGSSLQVYYGKPLQVFHQLVKEYNIGGLFFNHDYEPAANQRDTVITEYLQLHGITVKSYKDQVVFDQNEVIKDDGTPYTVFTPYSKKWKAKLNNFYLKPYPTEKYFKGLLKQEPQPIPSLQDIGFKPSNISFPESKVHAEVIKKYAQQRDIPGIAGTSRLGVHLRFGTLSIRQLARYALGKSDSFMNELIWRDFYQMIMHQFPKVGQGYCFKPAYENIKWINNLHEFELWCQGKTGYPLVDAGMRELNATGFMHNRVRMVVASFLTKHLLIDWRWGEAYFAQKLLDFDLAANNGGWQWAAGCGCDAAPYFRVFNPTLQMQRFDPQYIYIKKWVLEFDTAAYPKPIIDHAIARVRAIEVYKKGLVVA